MRGCVYVKVLNPSKNFFILASSFPNAKHIPESEHIVFKKRERFLTSADVTKLFGDTATRGGERIISGIGAAAAAAAAVPFIHFPVFGLRIVPRAHFFTQRPVLGFISLSSGHFCFIDFFASSAGAGAGGTGAGGTGAGGTGAGAAPFTQFPVVLLRIVPGAHFFIQRPVLGFISLSSGHFFFVDDFDAAAGAGGAGAGAAGAGAAPLFTHFPVIVLRIVH